MPRIFPRITKSESPQQEAPLVDEPLVDLQRRRDQLNTKVGELQWDLGGLVYEMAVRDRIRVDVIVKQAAALQDVDHELAEVERIIHLEQTGIAGVCTHCNAPRSSGAAFCWQCGQEIMQRVDTSSIFSGGASE